MIRRLSFAALALLGAAQVRPETLVARASTADVQQRVLELVNEARSRPRRCGSEKFSAAEPLTDSEILQRAARAHARDMAKREFFDHRAPDGSEPRDRVRRAGYQPRLTGENIAFGPESAEEVVTGWLASPGHCANIMDPRFSDSGVAFATGRRRGHIYWVHQFGSPAPARR